MHRLLVAAMRSKDGERLYQVACTCGRYIPAATLYRPWQARQAAVNHIRDTMDIRTTDAFERQLEQASCS